MAFKSLISRIVVCSRESSVILVFVFYFYKCKYSIGIEGNWTHVGLEQQEMLFLYRMNGYFK